MENISVRWHEEHENLLVYSAVEHWNVNDLVGALAQAHVMIDAAEGGVDTILDATRTERVPDGLLIRLQEIGDMVHPRSRFVVVVTGHRFLRQMTSIFSRAVYKVASAADVEDAIQIVLERRAEQERSSLR